METKKCTHCGRVLPTSNFHKSSYTKDGLYPTCKDCRKEQQKKNHVLNVALPLSLIRHLPILPRRS